MTLFSKGSSPVLFIILLFLTGCSFRTNSSNRTDEEQIRSVAQKYVETFNKQDAKQLSSLWSTDGQLTNYSDRETLVGQKSISEYFRSRFDANPQAEISVAIDSVKFTSDTKAIVRGHFKVVHSDTHQETISFQIMFVCLDRVWKIHEMNEITLEPPPSHYDHLKDLDWLVGTWIHKTEGMTFSSEYSWDTNKNFLIQHFTTKILDHDELAGEQIIGWDPMQTSIRSWVFDSDGGFGQSTWSYVDSRWYVDMVFVLSNGSRATATHIIEKIDDSTYSFSSTGRDIEGKVLPNIGPFTVVRVQ